MKSGSKVGRRNNATLPFRMVYPEKGGRVVTSPHFSPIKWVKTATWSHSVNVAEANDVLEMHTHTPFTTQQQQHTTHTTTHNNTHNNTTQQHTQPQHNHNTTTTTTQHTTHNNNIQHTTHCTLHTCTSAHLHTCTPAHNTQHTTHCTPAHLHTCTPAHYTLHTTGRSRCYVVPDSSAYLASISSAKRLKVRDNVNRFDTIFTEILEEFSDLTQELKRTDDHLPPASGASWAPLQSCWSAPFPQKRTTLQSTASSLPCSLAARDSLEIGSSMAKRQNKHLRD